MRLPAAFNPGASGFDQVFATRLTHPYSAAVNPANGDVAIYNREVLSLFSRNESGRYEERRTKELPGTDSAVVAISGEKVVLGTTAGEIQIYDAANLHQQRIFQPAEGVAPRFIEASTNGRYFAILLHDRTLWIFDAELDELSHADVGGQGDISGVAFAGEDRLLAADRVSRVSEYGVSALDLIRRVETDPDWLEVLYRYVVVPLHTVFPKPTQISNLTTYLIADRRTIGRGPTDVDLSTRQSKLDIWGPIWSNLAFLGVMLAVGCIYTARRDF